MLIDMTPQNDMKSQNLPAPVHKLSLPVQLICWGGLFFWTQPGIATPPTPEEKKADWLEYYFEHPTPDQFVSEMKKWSADGTLKNKAALPALIAFTSQLIQQNPEKLTDWYEKLAGLTPDEKSVFHTAMLLSRTKEADELMRKQFGRVYDEQKRETQKILELPLDKKTTLDMLWGFYYATGSEQAIRRIILCFRFLDAPKHPDGVKVPPGYVPLYKELPQAAYVSLASNCERHPSLIKMCQKIYTKDDSLVPSEKQELYDLLSEFLPKKYPPKHSP